MLTIDLSRTIKRLAIVRLPIQLLLGFILLTVIFTACGDFLNKNNGTELKLQTTHSQDQTTIFNGDTLIFIPIDVREEPPEDYDFPEFTSEMRGSQIVINGYYLASSRFKPEGTINIDGNTVTIRIQALENLDFVFNEPQGYFYDAFISYLDEKEYSVEIIHRNDGLRGKADEEHMVFTKEFVIE